MVRSEENISWIEKLKIAGIIGVALFVVSMIIWSSFEAEIQQSLAGFLDSVQNFFLGFSMHLS